MTISDSSSTLSIETLPYMLEILARENNKSAPSSSALQLLQKLKNTKHVSTLLLPQLKQMVALYSEMVSILENGNLIEETQPVEPAIVRENREHKQAPKKQPASKAIRYLESVIDEVLYITCSYNYCYVYYKDGRQETHSDCIRISLKQVHEHFGEKLTKVHSSFLVNPNCIAECKKRSSKKDYDIVLKDDFDAETIVPVSRNLASTLSITDQCD